MALLDDEAEVSEIGDQVPAGASSSHGRSVLQRSIPSWDEAIGFIVDANMQTRTRQRPASSSGGQRGGGRGGRRRGGRRSGPPSDVPSES
jgi:hypothetical protein